jgi:hypothetical protein
MVILLFSQYPSTAQFRKPHDKVVADQDDDADDSSGYRKWLLYNFFKARSVNGSRF